MSPTSYLCSIPHLVEVGGIEPPFEIATVNLSVLKSHLPYHSHFEAPVVDR